MMWTMLHGETTDTDRLVAEIEAYCERAGMAETTFGRKALNDGKVVSRLRSGGRVWPETAERVRQFIRDNPAQRDERDSAA